MTRTTNARIAGFTFLAYIAAAYATGVVFGHAAGGENTAAQLASIAEHTAGMHAVVLLTLVQAFAAIILAVTLYGITRDQDRDLSILAMICRVVEGIFNAFAASTSLAVLWLATASGSDEPVAGAARTLGAYLLRDGSGTVIFFAVGSLLFAWLLLRGRGIPVALAWLGVAASVILVIGIPVQLVFPVPNWTIWLLWLPMLAYEIPLGLWLLIKGVGASRPREPGRTDVAARA